MIEVRYNGRLGNNMFQYCFGRILAERLGMELRAEPIPGFPNTAEPVRGAHYAQPEEVLRGQRVDLSLVFGNPRPRKIVIDGWMQQFDYYRPYREQIRNWLKFDPAIRQVSAPPDMVVVHVRRTDYVQFGWALPFSFYEEALAQILPHGGRVCIVTDDRRDPFFRRFAPWKPSFFTGTALEDMRFMTGAHRLIISESSFGWWPAFLGDPVEVICPVSQFGAWHDRGNAAENPALVERDRFSCMEVREPYVATVRESSYQSRRLLWWRLILSLNRRFHLSIPEPLR